jgi:hypothetical protein
MQATLSAIPENKLTLIVLSEDDFENSFKDENEIEIDGQMYDVSKIINEGKIVKVYCLHDTEEDNLLMFLDELSNTPVHDDQLANTVLQFLTLQYLPVSSEIIFFRSASKIFFTDYTFSIKDSLFAVDSPPPRC